MIICLDSGNYVCNKYRIYKSVRLPGALSSPTVYRFMNGRPKQTEHGSATGRWIW